MFNCIVPCEDMKDTKQEQDWLDYGIVPGPVYNNFDVCDPNSYICSFEYYHKETKRQIIYDLYLPDRFDGQSYVYRCDEEWEGSYGSAPLETLFSASRICTLHQQILHILCGLGKFSWKPRTIKIAV
jgi:hypothetical protein